MEWRLNINMELSLAGYINSDFASISKVINLQKDCINCCEDEVYVTFRECSFICPSALVILGALPNIGKINNKKIKLCIETIENYNLKKYIINSGFYNYLMPNLNVNLANKNAIVFKKFDLMDKDNTEEIINYINNIIKLAHVTMDENVKAELTGNIYEIFANAFQHSKSKAGIFCCGHYFPKKKELTFCIYDAGIGIPNNVRTIDEYKLYSSSQTLEWAFKSGNTTLQNLDYKRGLGLGFLTEFIKLNNGNITTFSADAYCLINNINQHFKDIEIKIVGTVFNISIKDDTDHIYTS